MKQFVEKYVKSCLSCNYYKNNSLRNEGLMRPIEKIPVPFHTLHLDHLGPFETSVKSNKYLLVIVNGFTKFVVIESVKDIRAKAITEIVYLFGAPTRIISNRGSAFTSQKFKMFCQIENVNV